MFKITRQPNQQIWLWSDTHYSHKNICRATSQWTDKYTCRDFNSLDEMNAAIVNGFNKLVKPDDIVFHLGDVIFGTKQLLPDFLAQLSCKNIYLVMGNHDDWLGNADWAKKLFIQVWSFGVEVALNGKLFVLCHYPMEVWRDNNKGSIMCHGHCHHNLKDNINMRRLDVGVDSDAYGHEKYTPWSLDEVLDVCYNRKSAFKALDHHR